MKHVLTDDFTLVTVNAQDFRGGGREQPGTAEFRGHQQHPEGAVAAVESAAGFIHTLDTAGVVHGRLLLAGGDVGQAIRLNVRRNRANASPKKAVPIAPMANRRGQITSKPAPR